MWWGGWWLFPMIMCIAMVIFFFLILGRRGFRPPWMGYSDRHHSSESTESETSLEILKKRYAKGEISKEEFEQMKRDISS
jgi:putative membrane protein